jgi:hypothetical protein
MHGEGLDVHLDNLQPRLALSECHGLARGAHVGVRAYSGRLARAASTSYLKAWNEPGAPRPAPFPDQLLAGRLGPARLSHVLGAMPTWPRVSDKPLACRSTIGERLLWGTVGRPPRPGAAQLLSFISMYLSVPILTYMVWPVPLRPSGSGHDQVEVR